MREGCQNWPLSYNLGMARPIVIEIGVLFRDQVTMHIIQLMVGGGGVDFPPFPYLGNSWTACDKIWRLVRDP